MEKTETTAVTSANDAKITARQTAAKALAEGTMSLQFSSGPPFAESYNERKVRIAAEAAAK